MNAIYLIWSNEHVAWWRPDRCGYTAYIDAAGRYSREDAIKICSSANYGFIQDDENPCEIPVLEQDALEAMQARPWKAKTGMRKKKIKRY